MRLRSCTAVLACALLGAVNADTTSSAASERDIAAGGAFTCDFGLSGATPFEQIPPAIERDRMYMSARQGLIRKYIPLRIDPLTSEVTSGGRYLFDTKEDADAYDTWVKNEFTLDAVQFFDRPDFVAPDCRSWSVIGAHDFTGIETTHVLVRTERWQAPLANQRPLLLKRWPSLRAMAAEQGYASVWLLYDRHDGIVSIVSSVNRFVASDPDVPDFASLLTLESLPSLGDSFADQKWTRVFTRSSWILTIWFPFQTGDTGLPSLWPNSPPFPQPYAGDGVCEVSRGESWLNAPSDCLATCGDGVAQDGETTFNCPGDVRL